MLGARYQHLAEHYSRGACRLGAKGPCNEVEAEAAVNETNKQVMGLAEAAFATVQALNMAIEARLIEINERIPRRMAAPDGNT